MKFIIQLQSMFNLCIICTRKRDILYGLSEETSCMVFKSEFSTLLTIEGITTFEKCCTYFNNYLMEMDKLFMKRRKSTFLRLKNVLNEGKAEMIYEQTLSWSDTGEYLQIFLKIMSKNDTCTITQLNNERMKIIVDIMYRMTKRIRYLTVSVNSLLEYTPVSHNYKGYLNFMNACREFFALIHSKNDTICSFPSYSELKEAQECVKSMIPSISNYENILDNMTMIILRYLRYAKEEKLLKEMMESKKNLS